MLPLPRAFQRLFIRLLGKVTRISALNTALKMIFLGLCVLSVTSFMEARSLDSKMADADGGAEDLLGLGRFWAWRERC